MAGAVDRATGGVVARAVGNVDRDTMEAFAGAVAAMGAKIYADGIVRVSVHGVGGTQSWRVRQGRCSHQRDRVVLGDRQACV